jgi:ketosteroid isomerase-like protein
MDFRLIVALLLLAAAFPAGAQSPENDHTDQSTVLALENAWNQAVQQKAAAALDLLLANDLVYIEYDGTLMNKTEYLSSVKAQSYHATRIMNESISAHSFGEMVVVYGVYREIGTLSGGKPYLRRERFTDLWVRRKSAWVCVISQSTSIP